MNLPAKLLPLPRLKSRISSSPPTNEVISWFRVDDIAYGSGSKWKPFFKSNGNNKPDWLTQCHQMPSTFGHGKSLLELLQREHWHSHANWKWSKLEHLSQSLTRVAIDSKSSPRDNLLLISFHMSNAVWKRVLQNLELTSMQLPCFSLCFPKRKVYQIPGWMINPHPSSSLAFVTHCA